MAKYDQLLLEYGGGVINPYSQSIACKDEASVVIGIGGTGIAALKRLKRNIYQRLLPDDPSAPVPTYSHIKFIAIDSDDIDPGLGRGKLSKNEIFDIRIPAGVLGTEKGKQTVRNDSRMSWMDIDNITAPHCTYYGAGGIRQVGRYLLMSKADQLKLTLQLACISAMHAAHTHSVNVYIFAGISGGTGGGCFIDTCYIVRQLMNEHGWAASGRIMGFFFLPDVVCSRREVAASLTAVRCNRSNGYAAMKELDYLMNLSQAEDHFYQNYGGFVIDTKEPPVDMCHLISAIKANGQVGSDGFGYCINIVADYVMSYLIDPSGGQVHLGGMPAFLTTHGAHRNYHVIGISNAEIPMTQFSTYLAAEFMNRFSQMIGREKVSANITRQTVNEWAKKINLTGNGILAKINQGTTSFMLPEVDKVVLRILGQMPRGKAPESWAIPGNNFLDVSEGKRTANCKGLKQGIADYSPENLSTGQTVSVICSIFNLLQTICTDPEYGPYYAAHLVHNNGYDLGAVIDGLISTYEELKGTQELYLYGRGNGGGIADDIVQVSADYINSRFFNERKAYSCYKMTVENYFITINRIRELESAISLMKTVKLQLDQLYQNYFVPMIEMLDNLKETFDENLDYLTFLNYSQTSDYTWQIMKLSDVKDSLDDVIRMLTPKSLVTDFLDAVMQNYQEWVNRDSDCITAFISSFMSRMFDSQMNTCFEDYLKIMYPKDASSPWQMAGRIQGEIISRIFNNAAATFWWDPNFSIGADTYQTASISVPLTAPTVCAAANNFAFFTGSCIVRNTVLKDRIFAIRLFSGIPFYAYNGVSLLKDEYDHCRAGSLGAGLHLYAKTGRGDDSTGEKDWVNFLPELVPYSKDKSMTENVDEKVDIYKKACEFGIIGPDAGDSDRWLLRVSKPFEEKKYSVEEFMTEDTRKRRILNQLAIESTRKTIKDRLEHGWEEEKLERFIVMKNDGDWRYGEEVVSAVRMDYFLEFPLWQVIAREEIRKHNVLEEQLRQLTEIEKEYYEKKESLKEFYGMLLYGILKSVNCHGEESYTKITRIYYTYEKFGLRIETVFSAPGKEFPYGEQYPLYQAYLSYSNLDREKMPREQMLEKYVERKYGALRASDNIIGRTLELQWDHKAMFKLSTDVATYPEGKEILSFYTGLLQQIQDFKNKFEYEDWIKLPDSELK